MWLVPAVQALVAIFEMDGWLSTYCISIGDNQLKSAPEELLLRRSRNDDVFSQFIFVYQARWRVRA
eukprot:scaffold78713_cov59-Attheya_sp.AAC.1